MPAHTHQHSSQSHLTRQLAALDLRGLSGSRRRSLERDEPTSTQSSPDTPVYQRGRNRHDKHYGSGKNDVPTSPVSSRPLRPFHNSIPTPRRAPEVHIRPTYLQTVSRPSSRSLDPPPRKSKLLILDLDNTLFAPATPQLTGSVVKARPYLRTFLRYLCHRKSPWQVAMWSFSGQAFAVAHLRSLHVGDLLFDDDVMLNPDRKWPLREIWGFEQSHIDLHGLRPRVKDLQLMWDAVNAQNGNEGAHFDATNSLLIDDQLSNGRAQPDNIIRVPVFTLKSQPDSQLLAMIGQLDELSHESNFGAAIHARRLDRCIPPYKVQGYVRRGMEVCDRLKIKSYDYAPLKPADPIYVQRAFAELKQGPIHDDHSEPVPQVAYDDDEEEDDHTPETSSTDDDEVQRPSRRQSPVRRARPVSMYSPVTRVDNNTDDDDAVENDVPRRQNGRH